MRLPFIRSLLLLVPISLLLVNVPLLAQRIAPRASWTGSRLAGSPEPPAPYIVERIYPELEFKEPVIFTHLPSSERVFVVERAGKIFTFVPSKNLTDASTATPTLDLAIDLAADIKGIQAIYGLTFDPDFADNQFCYICYIRAANDDNGTVVSRFVMSTDDPPRIDAASEKQLIHWKSGGHNGGCLKFGPDGKLYITTGDGASPNPPDGLATGQGVDDLLSCLLRIDVHPADDTIPYAVPADNPFVDRPGARPEIWAFGFRNPWKLSINERNGELWIGDVGWELYEMVYLVKRGGNYGWSVMEGPQPVRGEIQPGPGPILPPIAHHHHVESKSITGGHVYRGKRLKSLTGAYIYGDYVTGKIWGLRNRGDEVTWHKELAHSSLAVIAFGQDRQSNLYLLDYAGGIYRLVENPDKEQNNNFPRRLSETGLFASVRAQQPAEGVVPFTVASPHWADHASASYLVGVPGSDPIELRKDVLSFPEGTVLAKTLSIRTDRTRSESSRAIETQLLVYQGGEWDAFSYAWNDDQTDAELVPAEGSQRDLQIKDPAIPGGSENYSWRFHSRAECLTCHNTRHGQLIGFLVPQLNHSIGKQQSASISQLDTMRQNGLIRWIEHQEAAADKKPSSADLPSLVDHRDDSEDLTARARSYLFTNCAHCHMPGGGGTATIDLRHSVTQELTKTVGAKPSQGNFLLQDARIIAPGDPHGSVLLYRIAKTGSGHMPHIGPRLVDSASVNLIRNWIASMQPQGATELINRRRQEQQLSRQFVDSSASEQKRRQLAESLLATPSGALSLSVALQGERIDPDLVQQIVKDRPLHISDLFDRYLLESQRTKRLGELINPAEILDQKGNIQRGRQLFVQEVTVQCRNCHQLAGAGKQVGRDLSDVGLRLTREQILESILYPSRKIEPAYSSYIVETIDGRVLTGLLKLKTDQQVVLVTVDAKEVSIPADEVALLVRQPKSLMPDLLLRELTAQQVADLLAFLVSQRKVPNSPLGNQERGNGSR